MQKFGKSHFGSLSEKSNNCTGASCILCKYSANKIRYKYWVGSGRLFKYHRADNWNHYLILENPAKVQTLRKSIFSGKKLLFEEVGFNFLLILRKTTNHGQVNRGFTLEPIKSRLFFSRSIRQPVNTNLECEIITSLSILDARLSLLNIVYYN